MEMSVFHHHLWFVRSRMGAWDHPRRGHKQFIDLHAQANDGCRRIYLPAHLGWWAASTWSGAHGRPTFPDDIEYLCCKSIGTDAGFSLMGIDPLTMRESPALSRLARVIQRYEHVRAANVLPESVKARLRAPGEEFTLTRGPDGEHSFAPIRYTQHKVVALDGWSNVWTTGNEFERQPAGLRIEALMAAGPYDAPDSACLADFSNCDGFSERAAADGVRADLQPSEDRTIAGATSGCYTATDERSGPRSGATSVDMPFSLLEHGIRTLRPQASAWTKVARAYSPPLDLSQHQGLGVWVYGDGKGEVLNLQLSSPEHVNTAVADHYVTVDFTGWRYFELIEPEGGRYGDYLWPYGANVYGIYRESVRHDQVKFLSLWYNNLPPGDTATCYLSPIVALPLLTVTVRNPAITVGGRRIVFPVEMRSGYYLEFLSMSDCTLYGPSGEPLGDVVPRGGAPILEPGDNRVEFECEVDREINARAFVTMIARGNPLTEG